MTSTLRVEVLISKIQRCCLLFVCSTAVSLYISNAIRTTTYNLQPCFPGRTKKFKKCLPEFHCSSLERYTQEECCDHGGSSGLTMLHSTPANFKEQKKKYKSRFCFHTR